MLRVWHNGEHAPGDLRVDSGRDGALAAVSEVDEDGGNLVGGLTFAVHHLGESRARPPPVVDHREADVGLAAQRWGLRRLLGRELAVADLARSCSNVSFTSALRGPNLARCRPLGSGGRAIGDPPRRAHCSGLAGYRLGVGPPWLRPCGGPGRPALPLPGRRRRADPAPVGRRRARRDVDWLLVEADGDAVFLKHGDGTPIGTVSVASLETLPAALSSLEQLVVESGYDVGDVDVRLSVLRGMTDALDRYTRILEGSAWPGSTSGCAARWSASARRSGSMAIACASWSWWTAGRRRRAACSWGTAWFASTACRPSTCPPARPPGGSAGSGHHRGPDRRP